MNIHTQPAYRQSVDDVLKNYQTKKSGLSTAEVAKRIEANGYNELVTIKAEPLWRRYLRQFQDWMIILLLVSAVISGYLGDVRTTVVLIALVLFNTIIGFAQEFRAEKTMQALEKLVQARAEVYRSGKLEEIESRCLVLGDIVRLSEGESVPADVRLFQTMAFATNDFALTGESDPTRKYIHVIRADVPVANRHNIAYAGTTTATGEALGVVIAIGMDTELGRIASLSQSAPIEPSPLQLELRHIARYVTYGVTVLSLVLLIVAIAIHLPFKDALLFAVGFASSLIPQGLPAEVNTSLAQAAGKMSRAKALVKKLSAVETLGATHVICTDKTGTLTKNEMTVQQVSIGGVAYQISGLGYEPTGQLQTKGKTLSKTEIDGLSGFFRTGLMANNARLLAPDQQQSQWRVLGDPTEGALLTLAKKAGLNLEAEAQANEEVRELPFDSARKRMSSIRRHAGELTVYVKGAPEAIIECSTHIVLHGKIVPLTAALRVTLMAQHVGLAEQAMRNLLFATRHIDEALAKKGEIDDIEVGLTIQGMVSMIDPLRDAVPAAIKAAEAAHIKINIVTGDFAPTARAIARQAGLGNGRDKIIVITGEELQVMADDEVQRHALRGSIIFSRVNPEDKMRIVSLIKKAGKVVAVTGDGINDAPALKHANIGVAMGLTGTDVAKQASELVLLDDSFATLVAAIRQGRTIYANIKKGVLSCFTSNAAEMVVNFCSLILVATFGLPLAINVLQILAVDLLAELFPIAALGRDKEEGELMQARPRNQKDHILQKVSIIDILWSGGLIGILAIANYLFFFGRHDGVINPQTIAIATTLTYTTIVICQLLNIMQRRSVHGLFTRYQFSNKTFWFAMLGSIGVVLAISYVPAISTFFKSGPLALIDWLYIALAAIIFVAVREANLRLTRNRKSPLVAVPSLGAQFI